MTSAVSYQGKRLVREFAKFGTVGGISYIVDVGLYNVLRVAALDDRPLVAKMISVGAATMVAYVGNRRWTFRHRAAAGTARGLALFVLFNAIGMAITVGWLGLTHYVLGFTSLIADNLSGNGVGTALGTLFRWWSYRRWVFTAAEESPAERPATVAVPAGRWTDRQPAKRDRAA